MAAGIPNRKTHKWQELSSAVYRAFPWKRCLVAILLTLLAHALIYKAAPQTLTVLARTVVPPDPVVLLKNEEAEKIPQELLPEEFRKKPKFVPVNPTAPIATPKDESYFSAADQRAAQENPDPDSQERLPTNDGELTDSRAVSASALPRELLPPELRTPIPPTNVPEPSPTLKQAKGAEGEKISAPDIPVDSGSLKKGEDLAASGNGEGEDAVPDPAPRPIVAPPPGLKTITMRSNTAVNEIGACSIDAKYSEFGDYTQRMLEAIQAAWYIGVERTAIVQTQAVVVIEFTLNSDGTVDNAHIVYSNASMPASYACLDAVESRAPFDPWREDMRAFVGKDFETSRISFHYR